jgi:hypothetical protein
MKNNMVLRMQETIQPVYKDDGLPFKPHEFPIATAGSAGAFAGVDYGESPQMTSMSTAHHVLRYLLCEKNMGLPTSHMALDSCPSLPPHPYLSLSLSHTHAHSPPPLSTTPVLGLLDSWRIAGILPMSVDLTCFCHGLPTA